MAKDNDQLSPNDIVSISLGEGTIFTDFNGDNKIDHGFWINDLYFEVPPERISSQEENAYAEFQALRSNSSWKIPTGIASEIITVSLSIPHKHAIKNIDSRTDGSLGNNTGKRGGILDLILQFKHIPFSCIENAYLRSKLKIPATHNMVFCMHNLALSTSPGEPNVIVGTLTISLMAYTPYSDKWLFKKDWVSRNGLYFEDVNDVNLPGRVSYKTLNFMPSTIQGLMPNASDSEAAYKLSKSFAAYNYANYTIRGDQSFIINTKILGQDAAGASYPNSIVNPAFQTVESLNSIDLAFMRPFEVTRFARESEPFKVYMDWIHKQMENKIIDNEKIGNTFDFTKISPYGSENHDTGGAVLLKWKEFKNIQIDPVVADKIRLHIKRKIAFYRYDLFKNKRSTLALLGGDAETLSSLEGGGAAGASAPISIPKGNSRLKMKKSGNPDIDNLNGVFADRLTRMNQEAAALGYDVSVCSGYRDIAHQQRLYDENLRNNGGNPTGSVAKPGSSAHNWGLAVDLIVRGNGVEITRISSKNDYLNRDTPAWKALLKKYQLHQPLHPDNGPRAPEKWHVEPVETIGRRGKENFMRITNTLRDTGAPSGNTSSTTGSPNVVSSSNSPAVTRQTQTRAPGAQSANGVAQATPGAMHRYKTAQEAFADGKTVNAYGQVTERVEYNGILGKNPAGIPQATLDKMQRDADIKAGKIPADPTVPPTAQGNPDGAFYTEEAIKAALEKLPRGVTETDKSAFYKYNAQVNAMKADGWQIYDKDLTVFDLFYKEHELIITADGGLVPSDSPSPMVCDFISGTAFNLFKKIPLQGVIVPSAQFLGRQDNSYILSFKGNGLNAVKKLEIIKDTLKKQGIMYKYVPESYVLRVENNLINAFGDVYFVINGLESSTLPEQPGTYAMEMRLTGHDLYIKEQKIKRVSTVSNLETIESFLDELLRSFNPNGVYLGKTPGTNLIGFNNPGGLSAGHISFLSELASTVNLCNKLIIPDDYEFADPSYKLMYPENKKMIQYFKNVLFPTLGKDEPYKWMRQFEETAQFRYPPQENNTWRSFYYAAPKELDLIAKPIWDFILESSHEEYDLSDAPIRSMAFSTTDGADVLPYAKAKIAWGGKNGTIMYPYIAAHRTAMGIARNTFLFWHAKAIIGGDSSIGLREKYKLIFGDATTGDQTERTKRKILMLPELTGNPPAPDFANGSMNGIFLVPKIGFASKTLNGSADMAEGPGWAYKVSVNNGKRLTAADVIRSNNVTVQVIFRTSGDELLSGHPFGKTNIEDEYKFFSGKNTGNTSNVPTAPIATIVFEPPKPMSRLDFIMSDRVRNLTYGKEGLPSGIVAQMYDAYLADFPREIEAQRNLVAIQNAEIGSKNAIIARQNENIVKQNLTNKRSIYANWTITDYVGNTMKPRDQQKLSMPDNGFMDYVWNYLIIPYLNNAIRYSDIYLLATETPYFPKTRALLIGKEQNSIGATYEDLMLPAHPYWNEKGNNLSRGPAFTEPDFYLANPGVDSDIEEKSVSRIETQKTNLTPEQAYNYYVQLCADYAAGDVEGLSSSKVALNVEPKVGKADRKPEKTINAIQFDYHKSYNGPKTIIQKDPSVEKMGVDPKSTLVEWQEARLIFGDNLDLISPLNTNISEDGKLLNNRMLNWSYQDYDLFGGQEAIIRARQGYDDLNTGTGDPNMPTKTINPAMPIFQFHDRHNVENGDASPYMNFSNTRYPMFSKIKDAISSIGRKKLAARRAFPTVKIYFIEEDDIYNKEYVELDEIYTYSQVESVEITESRKRAASVCKITFLDPHGILSGFNQFSKAADPIMISQKMQGAEGSNGALDTEVTSPFLRDTKYEQSDVSFRLNVGLKIKVCLGFSNDANKLQEVFLGEISDVGLDGSGNRIDIIATGYGAELVAKTKGISEAEAQVTYNDTFDLLAHMMFEPEIIHFGRKKFNSISMFGESQSLKTNSIQYKETFAIGGMINAQKPGGFPGYSWFAEFTSSTVKQDLVDSFNRVFSDAAKIIAIEPYEGPQDDNIFAPNYLPIEGYYWYDYFKRWSGKVSADGDYRIIKTNAQGVEERDAVDIGIATVPVVGGALAIGAGLSAASWATFAGAAIIGGALASGPLAMALIIGAAIGVGILAAYATFIASTYVLAGVGAAYETIKRWWSGDNLEKLDKVQTIQITDPDALKYNIFYSTIWDVFEEMTYRHPGYVKHPRIYYKSNRMTMFFGLPDQNMWESAGDPIDTFNANKLFKEMAVDAENRYRTQYGVGEALVDGRRDIRDVRYETSVNRSSAKESRTSQILDDQSDITGNNNQVNKVYVDSKKLSQFLGYVRRRFKPFRKWHNVNSYTDIISNDIEATADGWYTEVQIQYTSVPKWGGDTKAEDAAEDVKTGATTPENANALVDWDADKVITKQANVDLQPQYVRSTSYQFVNAKSIGLAKTYARAILAKQAKDMYKGSLTIMGNPYIRPYDVIMLSDTYNNMYGPIEVEEVNHIFSPETGYVTVIYPDTFIVQEDTTPYVIMNGINHDVHMKTEYYMENTLAAFPKWGDLENYSSEGRAYMEDLSRVINAYRRSVQEQELDIAKINTLFFGSSAFRSSETYDGARRSTPIGNVPGIVPTAAVGVGVGSAGIAASSATGVAAIAGVTIGTGGIAAAALLTGALVAGAFYFYASSRITQMILNYIADSRAFIMIPLMREGQPMIAGINFGYGSGMHKSPMQYMRQYWMDGGMGRSLQESDMLMRHASIANRNGGKIDSFMARSELGWERFKFNFDNVFYDMGDYFFQDILFPEGNTDITPGAAAQVVDTLGKAVVP